MTVFLKQSTASQSVIIGAFVDDTDFKTVETGLTIANTDIKLMKNGAASVNKNSGGATHRINGDYSITLDATDTNTVGELRVNVNVTGALVVWATYQVLEETVFDLYYGSGDTGEVVLQGVTHTGAVIPTTTAVTNDVGITQAAADKAWSTTTRILTAATNITSDASAITMSSSGVVGTVNLVNTLTTYTGDTPQTGDNFVRIGVNGAGLSNIDLPNQTMDITGNITGNLSGSVGSVTAAVTTDRASIIGALGVEGVADAGGSTTTLVDAALTQADDFWIDSYILFTSGTNDGRLVKVTDFVAATDTITFTPTIGGAVGAGDTYILIGTAFANNASATVPQIVDGVWDELKSAHTTPNSFGDFLDIEVTSRAAPTDIVTAGAITTSSGAVSNVTTVATTTTNTDMRGTDSALLASSAPTNFGDLAITVTTGLVSVGTNNDKTGYSISGTITTLDGLENISTAQVNTEMVDVMTVDTQALPGQAAPPLAPTFSEAITWMYKGYRNRTSQTSTQWSLFADNETTVDAKATVSDDSTTAIKQEIVSGP